jgi:hypothetical protein
VVEVAVGQPLVLLEEQCRLVRVQVVVVALLVAMQRDLDVVVVVRVVLLELLKMEAMVSAGLW